MEHEPFQDPDEDPKVQEMIKNDLYEVPNVINKNLPVITAEKIKNLQVADPSVIIEL